MHTYARIYVIIKPALIMFVKPALTMPDAKVGSSRFIVRLAKPKPTDVGDLP